MEKPIEQKISEFLLKKRLALGKTQKEMSIFLFDTPKKKDWISRIETGSSSITIKSLSIIFTKLNCTIDILED